MRRDRRSSSPEGVSLPATTGGATMINGAHAIVYSTNPEADRAFLRDVLKMPNVDVGQGWLIFGLPPAEVAVHPTDDKEFHEFYLMCDNVEELVASMNESGIECGPLHSMGWGVLTQVILPGGGKLGIYQPRHARPKPMASKPAKKRTKPAAKKKSAAKVKKTAKKKARRR